MKNTFLKLLGISGLVVAGYLALSHGFESVTEKVLAKDLTTSISLTENTSQAVSASEVAKESLKEISDMSFEELGYSPEVMREFENKFNLGSSKITFEELTTEQSEYLYHLGALIDNAEQPILTKNEEIVDGEIKLNPQGEYSYSLQTLLMDVVAMSSQEKATKIVTDICQKHQINPNGKIKDLDTDIIKEIDDALFEASDHPKN